MRVADYPGVTVLQDNQPVGRTDADGYAVLPLLRAYDVNRVSIDEHDLPLDAQVDKLKIDAVPYYRSGLLFDFPVRRSHGATLHLRLDDGGPMPSGAIVRVVGRDEDFPVALNGEAYVTGLDQQNRLRASWKGQQLRVRRRVPAVRRTPARPRHLRLSWGDAMSRGSRPRAACRAGTRVRIALGFCLLSKGALGRLHLRHLHARS